MGRGETGAPGYDPADETRPPVDVEPWYPRLVVDPTLESVPDTPETRAYHRRVVSAVVDTGRREGGSHSDVAGSGEDDQEHDQGDQPEAPRAE